MNVKICQLLPSYETTEEKKQSIVTYKNTNVLDFTTGVGV